MFIVQSLDILHRHTNDPLWHCSSDSLAIAVAAPTWTALRFLAEPCSLDVILQPSFENLPLHHRAPMLIFAAAHLSTWNLLIPLQRVVHEFLSLPHPIHTPVIPPPSSSSVLTLDNDGHSELYFNLFLRALACSTRYSTAYSNYVVSTINQMSSLPSRFTIHPDTYSCLLLSTHNQVDPRNMHLQSRLLSPRLAKYLRDRMRAEHFEPSPKHLEAMLRFWGKEAVGNTNPNGERSIMARAIVQQLWEQLQDADPTLPLQAGHPNFDPTTDPILRSNTVYIGAQGSIKAVREVLTLFQNSTPTSPVLDALPPTSSQHSSASPKTKAELDKYDLTATMHSAANDMHVSSASLMKMLNKLASSYGGPAKIPLAAHTVFLRGLMFRKHFERARRWWNHAVVKSKHQQDRMSLTVGAQILTRGNRPHEAFATLEQHAWSPSTPPPDPSSDLKRKRLVRLTSISVTEWMVSLKRIARPDIVFQLWDYMYPLYGVLHTNETLNVMLQSARMAVIMDGRSVRTQLSNYIKLGRARFSSSLSSPHRVLVTDAEVRNHGKEIIRSLLGDPGDGDPKPYRGGLWRDKRPEDTARDIFLQIMFGMETEMEGTGGTSMAYSATTGRRGVKVGLANVRAPARSVRRDWDSDAGVVGLGLGLVELRLHRFEYKPGPEMYNWPLGVSDSKVDDAGNSGQRRAARSHYPHLVLDNTSFLNYFSLLAVTNRTPEVALTMAWMRELGIQPSQSTLGLAMVLWSEVSVEGPLVQAVARRGGGEPVDEYDRFVLWLEGWVGKRRIPGEDVLRKWRTIVRDMREARHRPPTTRNAKSI